MNVGVYKISKREGVKVTESMTKEELKELLRNFRDLQVQVQFIEKYKKDSELFYERNKKLEESIELVTAALEILNFREKFIIENHLILHYTWPETTLRFSDHFGSVNSRNERTLMRIQDRALRKMVSFIQKLDIENLYDENSKGC